MELISILKEFTIENSVALTSLWNGLTHPVLGIDHLFAMFCVGVVSAILGGRAVWTIPTSFVCTMGLAGIAGMHNHILPRIEIIIAVSLVVLGTIIAARVVIVRVGLPLPTWVAIAFVMAFGAAHGNAHGLEVPSSANPSAFTVGFMLTTASLHIIGVFVGLASIKRKWSAFAMEMFGIFTMALGLGLLTR